MPQLHLETMHHESNTFISYKFHYHFPNRKSLNWNSMIVSNNKDKNIITALIHREKKLKEAHKNSKRL